MKWFIKTYTFWYELYREFRIWNIFRKTANNNVDLLNNSNLRVDWIGRIYTVINLPEEVITAAVQVQQAYVLQQITKYGDLMLRIGLADVVYPEIERIKDSPSYLVIMWPVFEKLQFFSILVGTLRTILVTGSLYFIYRLTINNVDFSAIWQFISNQL